MVKLLAAVAGLALAGCQGTVTHRERIPFSGGDVELLITSVGSATDGEKYELTFNGGKKRQLFFSGWNFREFHAVERDGKFQIQMCEGHIEEADPIAITDTRPVWPDLNWNCIDKSHEA